MFPAEKIAQVVEGEFLRGDSALPRRAIHDSRLVHPGDLFVALPGHRTDGHQYLADAFGSGACAAIVSNAKDLPDNARNLIVVDDPALALQQLASAWRDTLTATFIGITGSNGKTTVKALLAHMLAAHGPTYVSPYNYNTEIGLPISILSMPPDMQFGVFELGAERPGDIAALARILQPSIGIIASVGPSHLDGFETVDAVASEKWSLVESLPERGVAIVNVDSPHLLNRTPNAPVPVVSAGLNGGEFRGQVLQAMPSLEVRVDEHNVDITCTLIGIHNARNLLLAATTANMLGMGWTSIAAQAASFEPLPHRLHPIQTSFGTILDDTYNANPASMAAALQVLASFGNEDSTRVFVFGEMHGLGADTERFHNEVVRQALSLPIDTILPVGKVSTAACLAVNDPKIAFLPRDGITRHVRQLAQKRASQSAIVLIKGSRALGLEALVEEFRLSG